MPTRNTDLTGHFDDFVSAEIAAGRFRNAREVLRAGLRLLVRQTSEERQKLAPRRSLAADGFSQLDQGRGVSISGDRQLTSLVNRISRRASATAKRRSRSA